MSLVITNRKPDNNRGPLLYLVRQGEALIPTTLDQFRTQITKPPLFFVHGFNNAADKAEAMADVIQKSVLSRTVIAFDWNSLGHVDTLSYERDRLRASTSGEDLTTVLSEFPNADVIAHSMGNFVMQHAQSVQVNHLAMVAADVNNTVLPGFKKVAHGLVAFCRDDGALDGSTILHLITVDGLPRLGCTGPLLHTTPPNFSSVDFTKMLADELNPIAKHSSYFFHNGFYDILNGFLAK